MSADGIELREISMKTITNEQNENTSPRRSKVKSFSIVEKQKVIEEFRNGGIHQAVRKYKVHESTIYKWLKQDLTKPKSKRKKL